MKPGWYAVTRCYDVREGLIPDAAEWLGCEWAYPSRGIIYRSPEPFESKGAATEWARSHDMDEGASEEWINLE